MNAKTYDPAKLSIEINGLRLNRESRDDMESRRHDLAPLATTETSKPATATTKNRKQKRAEQAAHNRAVRKLGGPTMAAAGVLLKQRAVLARLLSAMVAKHGGSVRLTVEDLDAARNVGLVAEKNAEGEPVLLIANGDAGEPLGMSVVDLVTLLAIGGKA